MRGAGDPWRSIFRIAAGLYWLYFAAQVGTAFAALRAPIQDAAAISTVPGLHEFLVSVVAPNWYPFAVAQIAVEAAVGICLVLGVAVRKAAFAGVILALYLALTFAYLTDNAGARWLYYLSVLVNAELLFVPPGGWSLARSRAVPRWLR